MPTHNKTDGTPCDGVLVWSKNTLKLTAKTTVRRECPVCGFRQHYNTSARQWLDDGHKPLAGADQQEGS